MPSCQSALQHQELKASIWLEQGRCLHGGLPRKKSKSSRSGETWKGRNMFTGQRIVSQVGGSCIWELKAFFGRGEAEEPGHWDMGKEAIWAAIGLLEWDKQEGSQEQEGS